MEKNINMNISEVPSESLITYISNYQVTKINKEQSKNCMIELLRRRSEGENLDFEKLISDKVNLLKSIGKGYIVKIDPRFDLNKSVEKIYNISPCMIFNRKESLIHVGIPTDEKIKQICSLEESIMFESDKNYLHLSLE